MNKIITFSIDGERGMKIAIGIFLMIAALVPSLIIIGQLLSTGKSSTDPWSLVPAGAIVLWGLSFLTDREWVTVNGEERTLTWRSARFWITWRTLTWQREEIEAIEIMPESPGKAYWHDITIRGRQGRLRLLSNTREYSPQVIRDTASLLDIPIENRLKSQG